MRIHLVTGGGRSLDSHLIDLLMDVGDEIIFLVNYFIGRKPNNVNWIVHPGFVLRHHGVSESIKLEVDRI